MLKEYLVNIGQETYISDCARSNYIVISCFMTNSNSVVQLPGSKIIPAEAVAGVAIFPALAQKSARRD
jgi:hypothetical protein